MHFAMTFVLSHPIDAFAFSGRIAIDDRPILLHDIAVAEEIGEPGGGLGGSRDCQGAGDWSVEPRLLEMQYAIRVTMEVSMRHQVIAGLSNLLIRIGVRVGLDSL